MEKKYNILRGDITVEIQKEETQKNIPWEEVLYFCIVTLIIILPFYYINESIFYAFLLIIAGNSLITVITQKLHFGLKSPHVFSVKTSRDKTSARIRLVAGILELVFYTFTITFSWFTLLAGFLFMKGLSVWKNESNPSQEGGSTGILRIAVVMSLFIAIGVSIYLNNSQRFICSGIYKNIQKIGENNSLSI